MGFSRVRTVFADEGDELLPPDQLQLAEAVRIRAELKILRERLKYQELHPRTADADEIKELKEQISAAEEKLRTLGVSR